MRGNSACLLLVAMILSGGVSAAQDAEGPLCLLTRDEMSELLGAPITRVDAVELECAYTSDPVERSLQVVLGIVPPDSFGPVDLSLLRGQHRSHGQEATIAGHPAWVADDGVWVDTGSDVLFVWPNVVFDADPPAMPDTAVAVAKLAVPRFSGAAVASPAAGSSADGG